jgi:hypothetical protein
LMPLRALTTLRLRSGQAPDTKVHKGCHVYTSAAPQLKFILNQSFFRLGLSGL